VFGKSSELTCGFHAIPISSSVLSAQVLMLLILDFNNLEGSSVKAIVGFSKAIPNYDSAISRVLINGFTANSLSKISISVEAKQIR
jgi:hypothetical protein